MTRFLCLLMVLWTAARADAKAAFQTPEQMIATSQAIALVRIERVEPASTKGQNWTYGQKAIARVERVFKGHLPAEVFLWGEENFVCARCQFSEGRALVFLKRDQMLWTGNNWQLGSRPIKDEQIEWFGDKGAFDLKYQPLAGVLQQVQKAIAKQDKAPKYDLSFLKSAAQPWHISDLDTSANPRDFSFDALKSWLQTLPVGSEIQFSPTCRGGWNPDETSLDEVAAFCYSRGLQWSVALAG